MAIEYDIPLNRFGGFAAEQILKLVGIESVTYDKSNACINIVRRHPFYNIKTEHLRIAINPRKDPCAYETREYITTGEIEKETTFVTHSGDGYTHTDLANMQCEIDCLLFNGHEDGITGFGSVDNHESLIYPALRCAEPTYKLNPEAVRILTYGIRGFVAAQAALEAAEERAEGEKEAV